VVEPLKPLKQMTYLCDSKFHVEPLFEHLKRDDTYGFIVVDGNGFLMASVRGSSVQVLARYTVDLPKKHRKGGQSAGRFYRQRLLARLAYLNKIGETATNSFIDPQTSLPSVIGIVVAGSAELKDYLVDHKHLDPRLQSKVLTVVDITYGGTFGLYSAINQSESFIKQSEISKTRTLIGKFLEETARCGLTTFGHQQVISALESGAVKTLLIDENLPLQRFKFIRNDQKVVMYANTYQEFKKQFKKAEDVPEDVSSRLFFDYILENYQKFGVNVEVVNATTDLGKQFCQGFGGLGAFLEYEFHDFEPDQETEEEHEDHKEEREEDEDDELDLYF
jgi:peptide chain release factor subunit 1